MARKSFLLKKTRVAGTTLKLFRYVDNFSPAICVTALRKLFDFPETNENIYLVISTKKTANSYKVRNYSTFQIQMFYGGKWHDYYLYSTTYHNFIHFRQKTGQEEVYVSIEYYEEEG